MQDVVPVKRPSSRVIVMDEIGRLLMLGIQDPGLDRLVWVPPGGGAEAGEVPVQTAQRELYEETGLKVELDELGLPIATTAGMWTAFDGVLFDADETYYGLRVAAFTPVETGFTRLEQQFVTEFRWWTLDELDATTDYFFPLGLTGLARRLLAGDLPEVPVPLPWR